MTSFNMTSEEKVWTMVQKQITFKEQPRKKGKEYDSFGQ